MGATEERTIRVQERMVTIDAAAIMVNGAHAGWTNAHMTGGLLMDNKAAFLSVVKGRRVSLMTVRQMDGDLVRWTESFLSDRMVEMIIEGNAMERHTVEVGVPQGSSVSPILLAIYTSVLINWVQEYVSETEGLFIVHGLRWVVTGSDVNQVVIILERWAAKSVEWVNRRGQQFDTTNPEAVLFGTTLPHTKLLRPKLTAMIRVGNGSIRFNEEATHWLGIWMDALLMLNGYNNRCMKKASVAEARLRSLTKTYGVVPESIHVVHVVCE
jgi:hypothetical protein